MQGHHPALARDSLTFHLFNLSPTEQGWRVTLDDEGDIEIIVASKEGQTKKWIPEALDQTRSPL